MAEEIREPQRTIPSAVTLVLGLALAVYAVVAVRLLAALGPDGVAATPAPLAAAVDAGQLDWAGPVVRIGAAAAGLALTLTLTLPLASVLGGLAVFTAGVVLRLLRLRVWRT